MRVRTDKVAKALKRQAAVRHREKMLRHALSMRNRLI